MEVEGIDNKIIESNAEFKIPKDFAKRFGNKIFHSANTSEVTRSDLSKTIAELVNRNIRNDVMYEKLLETFEYLLDNYPIDATSSILFDSIIDNREFNDDYEKQFKQFISFLIRKQKDPDGQLIHMGEASFSYVAGILCRVFDEVLRFSSNHIASINKLFSEIMATELQFIDLGSEYKITSDNLQNEIKGFDILIQPKDKYLFKDIYDLSRYIVEEKKYTQILGLKQVYATNVYEKVQTMLMTEMDLIFSKKIRDSQALEKMEERRLRSCSENELEKAEVEFVKAINFYRQNIRFIYQYVAIEDLRNLMVYICVILGFLVLIFGFFDLFGINLLQGLLVFLGMMIHSRLIFSRRAFKIFYNTKPDKELEMSKRVLHIYFTRMTQSQLNLFLKKIIERTEHAIYRNYYINFLHDLYLSVPEKNDMLISKNEFFNTIEIVNSLIFEI